VATLAGLLIGYHGCDISVAQSIVSSPKKLLKPSENTYDWLGHGIYFWESSPSRALAFAKEKQKWETSQGKSTIKKPAVLGAVIDPGNCLNLIDQEALEVVKLAYATFAAQETNAGRELPSNTGPRNLFRHLDCAVIQYLHQIQKGRTEPSFDTVRSVFIEGEPLYEGAGFRDKNHIQICVRNPKAIVGYFLPR
jgi:hypothetical protein